MIKLASCDAWGGESALFHIKQLRGRLAGDDRRAFLKRASASSPLISTMPSWLARVKSGEELVHAYAMGADEFFGANRNGDTWLASVLRGDHPNFVKYAWHYRNHRNQDPKISYGRIIDSGYNDAMGRTELLISLNGTKEAAARHGNLVADKEMSELEKNGTYAGSMATLVPYDICSYCGKQSKSPRDYCRGVDQGGTCKAGGLRDNMGALMEIDGGVHQLRAFNPSPNRFFDWSHIVAPSRQADRIAYVTGLVEKAAAEGRVLKSAELAEAAGLIIPPIVAFDRPRIGSITKVLKAAYEAAKIEEELRGELACDTDALAVDPRLQCSGAAPRIPSMDKLPQWFKAAAAKRICLPLQAFLELFADVSHEKSAAMAAVVQQELPGIYTRFLATEDFLDRLERSPYKAATEAAHAHARWINDACEAWSLDERFANRRVLAAAANNLQSLFSPVISSKCASVSDSASPAGQLAAEYALYKLGFLAEIPLESRLTFRLAILQNHLPYTCPGN